MKDRNTYRGETIGWGPWRAHWYSMCSKLCHGFSLECAACMAGEYVGDFEKAVELFAYKHCYRLWYRWANRPSGHYKKTLDRYL